MLFRWCVQRRVSVSLSLSDSHTHISIFRWCKQWRSTGTVWFLLLLILASLLDIAITFWIVNFTRSLLRISLHICEWMIQSLLWPSFKHLLVKKTNEFMGIPGWWRCKIWSRKIIMEKLNRAWIMNSENIFLHATTVIIEMIRGGAHAFCHDLLLFIYVARSSLYKKMFVIKIKCNFIRNFKVY